MLNNGIVLTFMTIVFSFLLYFEVKKNRPELLERVKPILNWFTKKFFKGLKFKNESEEEGIFVGKVKIPIKSVFLHSLTLGGTGSGKTATIFKPLMKQVMENKHYGATVLDPKGDLAKEMYALGQFYSREVILFDPLLPNVYFNPLQGKIDEVVDTFTSVFISTQVKDSPKYFQNAAEELLINAIKAVKYTKQEPTFEDINNLIVRGKNPTFLDNLTKMIDVEMDTNKRSELEHIKSYFKNYFKDDSREYEDSSSVRTFFNKIMMNGKLKGLFCNSSRANHIDLDSHINILNSSPRESSILCISPGGVKISKEDSVLTAEMKTFIGQLLIKYVQNEIFNRNGNEDTRRPHFLVIDEVQEFINPGMSQIFTQGRSYGLSCWVATQSLLQLTEADKAILLNARNKIFLGGVPVSDIELFIKQFFKKREKSVSISRSRSERNYTVGKNTSIVEKEQFEVAEILNSKIGTMYLTHINADGSQSEAKFTTANFLDKNIEQYIKLRAVLNDICFANGIEPTKDEEFVNWKIFALSNRLNVKVLEETLTEKGYPFKTEEYPLLQLKNGGKHRWKHSKY